MIVIRRGDKLDVPFLRSLLGHAYNWHVNVFDTDISLSRYADGWGRRGDTALIAMDSGHSVGAAWYRLFPATVPGYGFLDEGIPELTIVVVPSRQGEGIGKQLLDALLAKAKADGFESVSVSVESGSRETTSYLENRFEQAAEHGNTLILRRTL